MKQLLTIAACLILFSGCTITQKKLSEKEKLIGTWSSVDMSQNMAEDFNSMTFTFKKDGTCSAKATLVNGKTISITGTYTVTPGFIEMTVENEKEKIPYSFSGKNLVLIDPRQDSELTFERIK